MHKVVDAAQIQSEHDGLQPLGPELAAGVIMAGRIVAAALGVLGTVAVVSTATAQSSGNVGAGPSAAECQTARDMLSPAQRSKSTAAQRLEFARTNRVCVEIARADAVSRFVNSKGATPFSPSEQMAVAGMFQAESLAADQREAIEKAGSDFMGMTFGVGVGFSQAKGRVEDATIAQDGTIRVLSRPKQSPRVILEAHYYGLCKTEACRLANFGVGPFFGLAAANDTIEAFALGVMAGWKDTTATSPSGFSIGIGAVLDREVKFLAKGFEEGKAPPAGETAVAYEKRSKWSPILFFTRTF